MSRIAKSMDNATFLEAKIHISVLKYRLRKSHKCIDRRMIPTSHSVGGLPNRNFTVCIRLGRFNLVLKLLQGSAHHNVCEKVNSVVKCCEYQPSEYGDCLYAVIRRESSKRAATHGRRTFNTGHKYKSTQYMLFFLCYEGLW